MIKGEDLIRFFEENLGASFVDIKSGKPIRSCKNCHWCLDEVCCNADSNNCGAFVLMANACKHFMFKKTNK